MLLGKRVTNSNDWKIGPFCTILRRFFVWFLIIFPALNVTSFAESTNTFPAHIFEISEKILNELIVIYEERGFRQPSIDIEVKQRQPRHVWVKTSGILIKIQKIKTANGLRVSEIPPLSVEQIHLIGVIQLTKRVLREVLEIKSAFGIDKPAKRARYRNSRTTTDVYKNMARISLMLDKIVETSVKPADVYRVIVTIKTSLLRIHNFQDRQKEIGVYEIESRKSPRNVYVKTHLLLNNIIKMSEKPGYMPEGGVIALKLKGGRTMPSDVINVMQNILAEVYAIETKIGTTAKTQLVPLIPGKTPSDVYNKTMEAIAITEAIL